MYLRGCSGLRNCIWSPKENNILYCWLCRFAESRSLFPLFLFSLFPFGPAVAVAVGRLLFLWENLRCIICSCGLIIAREGIAKENNKARSYRPGDITMQCQRNILLWYFASSPAERCHSGFLFLKVQRHLETLHNAHISVFASSLKLDHHIFLWLSCHQGQHNITRSFQGQHNIT